MRRYDRQLPCPLTDEEALDRGKAASQHLLALDRAVFASVSDDRRQPVDLTVRGEHRTEQ